MLKIYPDVHIPVDTGDSPIQLPDIIVSKQELREAFIYGFQIGYGRGIDKGKMIKYKKFDMIEQYVEVYRIKDSEERSQYMNKVNGKISEGWVVKQMTGVGGSEGTSPSISILFERQKELREVD